MNDELINEIFKLISELGKLAGEYKQNNVSDLVTISKLNPGDEFKFSDHKWVLLGDEQGGKLVMMTKSIGDYMFDKDGCNDWSKSSLRKFLNSEFIKTLSSTNLMPFISDLIADNGHTEYEHSEDLVFILSDALYRKYRRQTEEYTEEPYIWTITPLSTTPDYDYYERLIQSDGAMKFATVDHELAVMPAILLNPETKVKK